MTLPENSGEKIPANEVKPFGDPETGPEHPIRPSGQRFHMFDAMRLLAAAGVVWVHAVPPDAVPLISFAARFCVPFFIFGSLVFLSMQLKRNPDTRWTTFFWHRFNRLYVPFLAWECIYILARHAKSMVFGTPAAEISFYTFFVNGVSYQLWFLPYIFILNIVAFPIVKHAITNSRFAWMVFICAMLGYVFCPHISINENHYFASHALWRIPSALLALGLAAIFPIALPFLRRPVFTILGVFLFAFALTLASWTHQRYFGLEALGGAGALLFALAPWRLPSVTPLSRYAFDVYIIHGLFVEAFKAVVHALGLPQSLMSEVCNVILSFIASIMVGVIIRRFSIRRWLLP